MTICTIRITYAVNILNYTLKRKTHQNMLDSLKAFHSTHLFINIYIAYLKSIIY
jgi:hypothetical protein